MPRLVITKGAGQGRDHAIGTECVLGRALDVDFVVEDVGVSRRHARVYRDGDVYVVADLGSRNGTFVNSQRVQAASLNDGDLIRVGGIEMVFRQKGVAPPANPPAAVVAVPPAVSVPRAAVPPRAVPPAPAPAKPATPAAPYAPPRKPLPKVVPTKRRGVF